ncbi:MAG: right-handed parallel beta-helix repeat-containing protein [Nitrospira sp.]|nr:right-handed parallel beta-helix repeat-containing protein [Nitrospira sp.]
MTRLKQAVGACILASAILPAIAAQAATYYVATTGNNSNAGTSSKPWRTVAYAVSKMTAGDTTYVKGGVYKETFVLFRQSGTQSAPIRLLNAPGEFPIIECIDQAAGHRVNMQSASGTRYPIGWITIEGFEIRRCNNGIKFYNLHNGTIRRNWIHHNTGGSGIFGWGTKVVIDRNIINSNGSSSAGGHGIYSNGSYFTITNNLIYDNEKYGIQLNGSTSSRYNSTVHAGPEYADSKNWTIANNTFAYQKGQAGLVVWGSTCHNARVENNIFYENAVKKGTGSEQGITFLSTTCTGTTVRNNLAYASGSGGTKFTAGAAPGLTQSGNVVNTINPKFANAPATFPSSPNFSLTSGSPAIDRGLSLSATKTSFPGISRPKQSGYDIGAYEYSGSTILTAPTSLRVVN